MDVVLIKLAEQIPLAILFLVFIVWAMNRQDKRDAIRDAAQFERDEAVQLAMDKRDELMRQFWAAQQMSNREVLERLAASVEKVHNRLEEHDQKTDVAIAKMEEATRPRGSVRKS